MRNIGDAVRASFLEFLTAVKEGLGMGGNSRVESAKITSTRLKALERPEYLKDKTVPPPEKDALEKAAEELAATTDKQALNKLGVSLPTIPGGADIRKRTTADMSHFRLAAYVATLSPEQVAAQEKSLAEQGQEPAE